MPAKSAQTFTREQCEQEAYRMRALVTTCANAARHPMRMCPQCDDMLVQADMLQYAASLRETIEERQAADAEVLRRWATGEPCVTCGQTIPTPSPTLNRKREVADVPD